jgi:hypothetical protein
MWSRKLFWSPYSIYIFRYSVSWLTYEYRQNYRVCHPNQLFSNSASSLWTSFFLRPYFKFDRYHHKKWYNLKLQQRSFRLLQENDKNFLKNIPMYNSLHTSWYRTAENISRWNSCEELFCKYLFAPWIFAIESRTANSFWHGIIGNLIKNLIVCSAVLISY